MYDDVLIPTDGSDTISQTLAHGLPIAANNDATVHSLYVVDSRVTAAAGEDTTSTDLERTLGTRVRRPSPPLRNERRPRGSRPSARCVRGTPAKTILEYADEQGIDLIVIGTRGKSPREKVTSLGSVSERVVDNASIPVFVVRNAGDK